jgi:hypothetical protein
MPGPAPPPRDFRVVALIAAYNEGDIVGQVVADLVSQGVEVVLIDDGSTDDTVARVEPFLGRGVLAIERRPASEAGSWSAILRRKEELAHELDASWFLHHDADELRDSPWEELDLRGALARVDRLGYNAVDFAVHEFWPTTEAPFDAGTDPRTAFTHWAPASQDDMLQVKAWKKTRVRVDLEPGGGHDVRFPGREVFPIRFLLRHYPIRSQEHGERKVHRDRLPRLAAEAGERGWHGQYAALAGRNRFVRDPDELIPFDAERARCALQLRHRGVEELERLLARAAEGDPPALRLAALEERAAALAERAEWLSRDLDERNRQAERLGSELDERNREAARLGSELDARNREAADLRDRLAAVEGRLATASHHLEQVLASRSWRWTAPLRRLQGIAAGEPPAPRAATGEPAVRRAAAAGPGGDAGGGDRP